MQGQTEQMDEQAEGGGTRLRTLLREMVTTIVDGRSDRTKDIVRLIGREPFARRSWSELSYLTIAAPLAAIGFACVAITLFAGVILAITFFGLAILALSVRLARGFGGLHRQLARGLLDEEIEDPEPFVSRPGFLGWLQSTLRDRTGWRSMAYVAVKVPLAILGILVGFAAWWDAFFCITYPVWGRVGGHVPVFGLPLLFFGRGLFTAGQSGFFHGAGRVLRRHRAVLCRSLGRAGRWCTSTVVSCGCCSPPTPWRRASACSSGPGRNGRLVGGDAAADRARPARWHPGPAGRPGHAARDGEGEAG